MKHSIKTDISVFYAERFVVIAMILAQLVGLEQVHQLGQGWGGQYDLRSQRCTARGRIERSVYAVKSSKEYTKVQRK